jgi:uncharacterized protein (TIGR02246 family)
MKSVNRFLITTLLSSTLFFSCVNLETKGTAKSSFDLATAKTEIEAMNKMTMDAFAKGDSVSIANVYTDDAKLMFTGAPAVVGKAAIQSIYGGYIKSGISKVNIVTTAVMGTEEMLAEEGNITIYVQDQIVGQEKFIVLWKKVDGQWKAFRDIANSDLPMQPSN